MNKQTLSELWENKREYFFDILQKENLNINRKQIPPSWTKSYLFISVLRLYNNKSELNISYCWIFSNKLDNRFMELLDTPCKDLYTMCPTISKKLNKCEVAYKILEIEFKNPHMIIKPILSSQNLTIEMIENLSAPKLTDLLNSYSIKRTKNRKNDIITLLNVMKNKGKLNDEDLKIVDDFRYFELLSRDVRIVKIQLNLDTETKIGEFKLCKDYLIEMKSNNHEIDKFSPYHGMNTNMIERILNNRDIDIPDNKLEELDTIDPEWSESIINRFVKFINNNRLDGGFKKAELYYLSGYLRLNYYGGSEWVEYISQLSEYELFDSIVLASFRRRTKYNVSLQMSRKELYEAIASGDKVRPVIRHLINCLSFSSVDRLITIYKIFDRKSNDIVDLYDRFDIEDLFILGYSPYFANNKLNNKLSRYEYLKKSISENSLTSKLLFRFYRILDGNFQNALIKLTKNEPLDFESYLIEITDDNYYQKSKELGMIIPPYVDRYEYFINNVFEYIDVYRKMKRCDNNIENLKELTDGCIFRKVLKCYIPYISREDLIKKTTDLINGKISFFFPIDRNPKNDKTYISLENTNNNDLFMIGYGSITEYECYELDELITCFSISGDGSFSFRSPNYISGSNFTIDEITELRNIISSFKILSSQYKNAPFTELIQSIDNGIKQIMNYKGIDRVFQDRFENLNQSERRQLFDILTYLFETGMYMRGWLGPGSEYPLDEDSTYSGILYNWVIDYYIKWYCPTDSNSDNIISTFSNVVDIKTKLELEYGNDYSNVLFNTVICNSLDKIRQVLKKSRNENSLQNQIRHYPIDQFKTDIKPKEYNYMGSTLENLVYDLNIVNFDGNVLLYNTSKLGYRIDQIYSENYCIRMASGEFISTAYYYFYLFYQHLIPNFYINALEHVS